MSCQQVPRIPEDPYTFTEPPVTAKFFSSQVIERNIITYTRKKKHNNNTAIKPFIFLSILWLLLGIALFHYVYYQYFTFISCALKPVRSRFFIMLHRHYKLFSLKKTTKHTVQPAAQPHKKPLPFQHLIVTMSVWYRSTYNSLLCSEQTFQASIK